MRYLVTGGAGFIGSHIVDALVNEGHEVLVIDNFASGKKDYLNHKANYQQVDITDESALNSLFRGVDGVFHTAAMARIQPSFQDPDLYFRTNAIGTRNVLLAAKKHGVKRVVYSASSSAYGQVDALPAKEDSRLASQALHPYGSTKRIGEMLMRDLGRVTGGPETVCLRYFNVYGHRQPSDSSSAYATVVGIFLDQLKQSKPLTIVPSGYQRRDFTWVEDVAGANLAAMQSSKVGDGEIINVGLGVSYSMWDVARLVLKMPLDTKPEELLTAGKCVFAPERRGEVNETLADITKAKELLDWEPKTGFEEGIKNLLETYPNNNPITRY